MSYNLSFARYLLHVGTRISQLHALCGISELSRKQNDNTNFHMHCCRFNVVLTQGVCNAQHAPCENVECKGPK